jgi:polysaccharide pyruvyl transferase WcaK-like protein
VYSLCTKKHSEDLIYRIRRRLLSKELKKKQLDVVFVGGQMFFDYFIPYINLFVESAAIANTKVYFYACGVGRLNEINKEQLKLALKKDNIGLISVRDNLASIKKLDVDVVFKPDVAICCDLNYVDIKLDLMDRNVIGLGVISISYYNKNNKGAEISEESYILMMCNLIKNIHALGFKIELFCNGEKGDYDMAVKISQRFNTVKVLVSELPNNAQELIKQIVKYKYVIASRLHALIISYSYNIPFIGLSWDEKVKEFFCLIDHPERCIDLFLLNDVDWNSTLQELNQGLKQEKRGKLRTEIISTIKNLMEC